MRAALQAICVAVVLAAISSIFWQHAQAWRYARPGVITVMPVVNDRPFMFSHDEVWNASAVFNGRIEMEHQTNRRIEAGQRFAFAHVSTVGQHYFDVAFLPFSSGREWAHGGGRNIILSERLAWELFGSLDAVGLYARIAESYYKITGVARDAAEPPGHVDGFAWVPRDHLNERGYYAAILHFIPDSYNLVQSNMDVLRILGLLHRRSGDYFIIDINAYTASIKLRGHLLLTMAGLAFVLAMLLCGLNIWQKRQDYDFMQGKKRWIWASCAFAACSVVVLMLAPYMPVDFWLPAFLPDGWRGYARLYFNAGLAVPRQYLPNYLAALFDLNARANLSFGIGLGALMLAAICAIRRGGKHKSA